MQRSCSRSCRPRRSAVLRAPSSPARRRFPRGRDYEAPEPAAQPSPAPQARPADGHFLGELRLVRYRPLFSGPQVERVRELQFQRPQAELELSADDAKRRSIATGDNVTVRSNGTSVELRARVNARLLAGVARVPDEHAADLHQMVEVVKRDRAARPGLGRERRALVDLADQGGDRDQPRPRHVRLSDARRAQVMGRMQLRYGPNRAGPYGLLQPIADLVKLIRKESFFPAGAIDVLYIASPFLAAFTAMCTFSVIPWGPGLGDRRLPGQRLRRRSPDRAAPDLRDRLARDLRLHPRRLGVRLEVRAARRDAHLRAARLVRGLARALRARRRDLMASSLSLVDIVAAQDDETGTCCRSSSASSIFLLAGTAETARAPFDLPEAEQELVAGYHTEYGGMRFGLFSMSEYINLITLSALCVTLFLGGWHGPLLPGPDLVPAQAVRAPVRVHLDPDDPAAPPLRPADAVRLEGAAAGRDAERGRHGDPRGGDLMGRR